MGFSTQSQVNLWSREGKSHSNFRIDNENEREAMSTQVGMSRLLQNLLESSSKLIKMHSLSLLQKLLEWHSGISSLQIYLGDSQIN